MEIIPTTIDQIFVHRRIDSVPLRSHFVAVMRLFVILIVVLLFSVQVHAVALGVNKATLSFADVLRGGYAEDIVTVTTDSEDMISAELLLDGESKDWFTFSAKVFNFSRDKPYQLHVIVQPPMDTQIQDYRVDMTIITSAIGKDTGTKMGSSTRASFRIPLQVRMSGTERIMCSGGGVQILDTEEGRPLDVKVSILNRGNVRINPNITIEIYDKLRSSLLQNRTVEFGDRILPTLTGTATRSLSMDLDAAQYWAVIRVPMCEYSDLQTFDVLPPGGIKDDGEFIRLEAQSWANTGDIVPITAVFRNKGARGIRAVLKGTIARVDNGQIVKVITSDEYVVDPGVTADMMTYFNPVVGGQYVVTAKVFYNNKLTIERSTLINVNGAPVKSAGGLSTVVIVIVIIIAILFLLILIRRKKDAQRRY